MDSQDRRHEMNQIPKGIDHICIYGHATSSVIWKLKWKWSKFKEIKR